MADVTVRADGNNRHYNYRHRDVVQLADKLTAYSYAYDGTSHMSYNKTTDGGANWGSKVNIQNEDFVRRFDVWYDKWTPGDTGNLIHMAILESDTDDVWYINLDPDDSDALSTKKQVFDGATVNGSQNHPADCPTIWKDKAGNLHIVFQLNNGGESGHYRSTDGGLNWTSRADPVEASSSDWFLGYPGNEADDADGYLIYYDDSAGALSMKVYDDSADSWAETSIDASVNGHNNHLGFHGTIDDNGDLFVVYWNDHDAATADLECGVWDSGGWTAKTDVVGNFDDIEDCCVFCDRNTGDLYVAYNGSDDGSESAHSTVKCYHKISNNGGTSWGTQQAMGETGDDNRSVRCDLGPQSGEDGLFLPIWSNDDLNDNFCNAGNAVEITGSSGFSGDIASLIAEVKAALVGAQTDPGVLTSKIASIKSALVGAMLPKGDIDSTAAPVKASLVGAKTYAGVLDSTAAPVKDSLVGTQTHPGALASKVASIKSAFVGAQTVPGVLASTVAYVKTALVGSQAGGPEFTGVLGSLIAPAKAALIGAQTVPGVLGSVASFESDGNGRPVQVVLTADAAASAATLTIKPDHPDLADNDVLLFGENIRIQVDGACLAGDISLAIDPAAVGPLKAGDIGKKLQDLTGYTIAGEVLAKRGDATAIIEFPSGDVTIPTQSTVANRGRLQVAYVAVDTSSENPGSYYGTIWKTDPGTTRPLWEGVVRVTEAGFL